MPRRYVLLMSALMFALASCAGEAPPEAPAPARPVVALPAEAFPSLEKGKAVPTGLLHERPSDEECAAACERLLSAETERFRGNLGGVLAEPDNADEFDAMLTGLRDRLRPYCVERCRADFTRATTACVMATEDVPRAVDCLDRTGAGSDHGWFVDRAKRGVPRAGGSEGAD